MAYEYKLPHIGEEVVGKVLEIRVKPGDAIAKDQIVMLIGTDKVDAEIPADIDGTVEEVCVKVGDEVQEGDLILRIAAAAAETPAGPSAPPAPATPQNKPASPKTETNANFVLHMPDMGENVTGKILEIKVKPGQTVQPDDLIAIVATDKVDAEVPAEKSGVVAEIFVKKGDEISGGSPLISLSGVSEAAGTNAAPQPTPPSPTPDPAVPSTVPDPSPSSTAASGSKVRTSPLARKRARELGIDLAQVPLPAGAARLSYKDVIEHVKNRMKAPAQTAGATGGVAHKPLPNFERFGEVERVDQSRIGVITADNMVYAFNAIPHAWISEKIDITRLEELRQQYKDTVKAAGGSLTTTAILTKAIAGLLRKMPQFNASYDPEKREVIFKKYYNIGIAVDTPRGLLVPVIRHADRKSLTEISVELSELSARTRDGKNKPDDLDGGTFSISNIGGIGGTNMLSIVNWPQVAILSVTAAAMEARWNGSQFEPRLMMPVTIGWDHRVINGADAARFLQSLKAILEEPFLGWL
ncbi:MAG: 2-oxo acid dehydrogenase subunit E2 [Saprospiraceae bacterium]